MLQNVPCEMRVHEDCVNTDLFTSSVQHGGMLSARGQARPWKDRFCDLLHIVKAIDAGFVNIDLPGQMEFKESFTAVQRAVQETKELLENKNVVVLVQGEPVVKYISHNGPRMYDAESAIDAAMRERCDGPMPCGIVRHDHKLYTDIIDSLSRFAVVYKTSLAEAFGHVAGQCIVQDAMPGHFLVRLPVSIVPMRFSGQCVGYSALGTGSILQDTLTYGNGNGGFLFDASVGKWSISFFARVVGVPADPF